MSETAWLWPSVCAGVGPGPTAKWVLESFSPLRGSEASQQELEWPVQSSGLSLVSDSQPVAGSGLGGRERLRVEVALPVPQGCRCWSLRVRTDSLNCRSSLTSPRARQPRVLASRNPLLAGMESKVIGTQEPPARKQRPARELGWAGRDGKAVRRRALWWVQP